MAPKPKPTRKAPTKGSKIPVPPATQPSRSRTNTPVGSGQSTPYPSVPHTPEVSSSDEEPLKSSLPIVLSPVKRRQRQQQNSVKNMSDIDVWDLDDDEIIGKFRIYSN